MKTEPRDKRRREALKRTMAYNYHPSNEILTIKIVRWKRAKDNPHSALSPSDKSLFTWDFTDPYLRQPKHPNTAERYVR